MIAMLRGLFRRRPSRDVRQAATALLLLPAPGDAWARARRNLLDAQEAGDEASAAHWSAVRTEIEDRTGYRRGADVATRYLEGGR